MNIKIKNTVLSMCFLFILVIMVSFYSPESIILADDSMSEVYINTPFKKNRSEKFYFTIPSSGTVTVASVIDNHDVIMCLDDGDTRERIAILSTSIYDREMYLQSIRLGAGTYIGYITDGSNEITINFVEEPASSYEQEKNNTFDTANEIETNLAYSGSVHFADRDYYKVTLPQSGSLYVEETILNRDISKIENGKIYIYSEDEDCNTHLVSEEAKRISNVRTSSKIRVPSGVYYILITSFSHRDDYSLKVCYSPEEPDSYETETNNTLDCANLISVNTPITGNLASSTDIDYYKFDLPSTGSFNLRLQTPRQTTDKLFNVELISITDTGSEKVIDTLYSSENPVVYGNKLTLDAGIYYAKVKYGVSQSDSHVDYIIQGIYEETKLIETIELTVPEQTLYKGTVFTVKAEISPTNALDKSLTWESTDPSIAKVDSTGKVSCLSPGETIIRATANDASKKYGEIRIKVEKLLVTNIEVTADDTELETGDTTKVYASVTPKNADNGMYIWESSDEDVVTVDQNGRVKAIGKGKASIIALAEDGSGISGRITITVSKSLSSDATLSKIKRTSGTINKKFSPSKTSYKIVLDSNTSKVTITPVKSDSSAKVSINGKDAKKVVVKVGRKKSKTAKILVTAEDGSKKQYTIKISRK